LLVWLNHLLPVKVTLGTSLLRGLAGALVGGGVAYGLALWLLSLVLCQACWRCRWVLPPACLSSGRKYACCCSCDKFFFIIVGDNRIHGLKPN